MWYTSVFTAFYEGTNCLSSTAVDLTVSFVCILLYFSALKLHCTLWFCIKDNIEFYIVHVLCPFMFLTFSCLSPAKFTATVT